MIRTEEEARQCWCPATRVTPEMPDTYGTTNRGQVVFPGEGNDKLNCIASRCMAWRWEPIELIRSITPGMGPTEHTYRERRDSEPKTGHCGLAGATWPS